MSKDKRKKNGHTKDGFQGPHSSRKHSYNQVNGETQMSQTDIITKNHKRRRDA